MQAQGSDRCSPPVLDAAGLRIAGRCLAHTEQKKEAPRAILRAIMTSLLSPRPQGATRSVASASEGLSICTRPQACRWVYLHWCAPMVDRVVVAGGRTHQRLCCYVAAVFVSARVYCAHVCTHVRAHVHACVRTAVRTPLCTRVFLFRTSLRSRAQCVQHRYACPHTPIPTPAHMSLF